MTNPRRRNPRRKIALAPERIKVFADDLHDYLTSGGACSVMGSCGDAAYWVFDFLRPFLPDVEVVYGELSQPGREPIPHWWVESKTAGLLVDAANPFEGAGVVSPLSDARYRGVRRKVLTRGDLRQVQEDYESRDLDPDYYRDLLRKNPRRRNSANTREEDENVPDCAWCGAACDQPHPYPNRRGEVFCSPSHRSASNRALARVLGTDGGSTPRRRLNPRDPQTETPAFKEWFRNSKIVDAEGNPLVVYHGGFDVLNSRNGTFRKSKTGALGSGIYFTPDRSAAEYYMAHRGGYEAVENGVITEVYLSVQNPLVVRPTHAEDPAVEALVLLGEDRDRAYDKVEKIRERVGDIGATLPNAARAAGYDGIIRIGWRDGEVAEILVFEPWQVKSATRNAGTYYPYGSDIRTNPRRNPATGVFSHDEGHQGTGKEVVGTLDGEPVGSIIVFSSASDLDKTLRREEFARVKGLPRGKVGWFGAIELPESSRNKGHGAAIVTAMLDEARGLGVGAVVLHADSAASQRFWSRMGFVEQKTQPEDVRRGVWMTPMVKTLSGRTNPDRWRRGKCLVFAEALKRVAGRKGTLYDVVEVTRLQTLPHHVVLRIGDTYWDSEGPSTEAELLARWEARAPAGVHLPLRLEKHDPKRARDFRYPNMKTCSVDDRADALLHAKRMLSGRTNPRRNPELGPMMEGFKRLLARPRVHQVLAEGVLPDGKPYRLTYQYGSSYYRMDNLRLKVGKRNVASVEGEMGPLYEGRGGHHIFIEHNAYTRPDARGKGYMQMLYTLLLDRGIGIRSDDYAHSLPMRRVWMALARSGFVFVQEMEKHPDGFPVPTGKFLRVKGDDVNDPLLDDTLFAAPGSTLKEAEKAVARMGKEHHLLSGMYGD